MTLSLCELGGERESLQVVVLASDIDGGKIGTDIQQDSRSQRGAAI